MKKLAERAGALLLGCVVAGTAGCMRTDGPKMPKELAAPSVVGYSQDEFNADVKSYRADVALGTKDGLDAAKAVRNEIAYRVMADVESSYGRFEMRLTTTRAAVETGADATQLGITAAVAVVGAGDVKDMLAASLSAFQGTRLSYDKNFFAEKTTEALISQMRANRKSLQAQIITNLATRDVTSYPLDAAWVDLVDFYYAGTVPSALVGIASDAGTQATQATTKLNNAVAALTPTTPEQEKTAYDIGGVYWKLRSEVNSTDAATVAQAQQELSAILTKAGYTVAPGATAADLLKQFQDAMEDANKSNDKLQALTAAIQAVNPK